MSASKRGSEPKLRSRPIYGGLFGQGGQFVLATLPCIDKGLHAVRHMVLEPASGVVLATSLDKRQALADARRLLRSAGSLAAAIAANDAVFEQVALWPDEELPRPELGVQSKPVPRRRREVFDKSEGRCFYCGKALTLDGKWHIEHQMPRALMGPDEPPNLVAACVPCNLAKGDKTALEYLVQRPQSA
ncbi:MAG: HNH endonuclease [Aquabacterium sp.]